MQELVSVVIPSYNRAHCVGRAIDSVLNQTYPCVEVLVVDDGSRDNTPEVMRDRYGRDARVKYVRQENRGVSAARNAGFRAAQGAYIALLDSDDVWKPWKLQVQVAGLNHLPKAGMIWSDMEAIDLQGRLISRHYLRTFYGAYRWFPKDRLFTEAHPLEEVVTGLGEVVRDGTLYAGDIYSPMVMGNLVHTSTVLLRRERLEKVGEFDEALLPGEDYDFHLRTCREGPVAFVDLDTIEYERGAADAITTKYGRGFAISFLNTLSATVARDKDRIKLPRAMLNLAFADANGWLGEEYLATGEYGPARKHLARSLWYKTWQPRLWGLMALSCVPRGVGQAVRQSVRRVKALAR